MISIIAAVILITVFILFFLSVIAPMHSQKKFWVIIRRIRGYMDISCYWFYNICAIATVLCIVYLGVRKIFNI